MSLINEKVERSFRLTQDLAAHLEEAHLGLSLPNLPSNKAGINATRFSQISPKFYRKMRFIVKCVSQATVIPA